MKDESMKDEPMRFTPTLLYILVLLLNLGESILCAQDFAQDQTSSTPTSSTPNSVKVNIRTVQASEQLKQPRENQPFDSVTDRVFIDTRLQDISQKLIKLPFNSFRFISLDKRVVTYKKKEVINLNGGQSLTIRPISYKDRQVCMWLKWLDKNGDNILDTRMHFNVDESTLTGTDHSPSSGVILAIDVAPVLSEAQQ